MEELERDKVRSKAEAISGAGRPILMNALADTVGVLNLDRVVVSVLYVWIRKLRKAQRWFAADGYDWLETKVAGKVAAQFVEALRDEDFELSLGVDGIADKFEWEKR